MASPLLRARVSVLCCVSVSFNLLKQVKLAIVVEEDCNWHRMTLILHLLPLFSGAAGSTSKRHRGRPSRSNTQLQEEDRL